MENKESKVLYGNEKMRVLHICNNYFGTKVYESLVDNLTSSNVLSYMLVLLPNSEEVRNTVDKKLSNENIKIIVIPNIINSISRLFPSIRLLFVANMVGFYMKKSINIVHSHTLHANGVIGEWLARKLNVPHVVSVRNVDVNLVYQFLIYQRNRMLMRLRRCSGSVFLNEVHKEYLASEIKKKYGDKCDVKMSVVPNPIDRYWFDNKFNAKKINKDTIRILFVGEFTRNKNIEFLLDVFEEQWMHGCKFELNLIGYVKDTVRSKEYYNYIKNKIYETGCASLVGEVNDKDVLRDYYLRSDIFFMTSFHETFGLVYVESMSQGTPIIYTKGQGIDGYFSSGKVGYAVDPVNVQEARNRVRCILSNYDYFSKNCINALDAFDPIKTSREIVKVYQDAM